MSSFFMYTTSFSQDEITEVSNRIVDAYPQVLRDIHCVIQTNNAIEGLPRRENMKQVAMDMLQSANPVCKKSGLILLQAWISRRGELAVGEFLKYAFDHPIVYSILVRLTFTENVLTVPFVVNHCNEICRMAFKTLCSSQKFAQVQASAWIVQLYNNESGQPELRLSWLHLTSLDCIKNVLNSNLDCKQKLATIQWSKLLQVEGVVECIKTLLLTRSDFCTPLLKRLLKLKKEPAVTNLLKDLNVKNVNWFQERHVDLSTFMNVSPGIREKVVLSPPTVVQWLEVMATFNASLFVTKKSYTKLFHVAFRLKGPRKLKNDPVRMYQVVEACMKAHATMVTTMVDHYKKLNDVTVEMPPWFHLPSFLHYCEHFDLSVLYAMHRLCAESRSWSLVNMYIQCLVQSFKAKKLMKLQAVRSMPHLDMGCIKHHWDEALMHNKDTNVQVYTKLVSAMKGVVEPNKLRKFTIELWTATGGAVPAYTPARHRRKSEPMVKDKCVTM